MSLSPSVKACILPLFVSWATLCVLYLMLRTSGCVRRPEAQAQQAEQPPAAKARGKGAEQYDGGSGLDTFRITVWTDPKTGAEYLLYGSNGIVPRGTSSTR